MYTMKLQFLMHKKDNQSFLVKFDEHYSVITQNSILYSSSSSHLSIFCFGFGEYVHILLGNQKHPKRQHVQ